MQSAFAPKPTFLVAAERRRRIEFVVRVGPDHASPHLRGHVEDF